MTNLFEKIFGKTEKPKERTSLIAMIDHTTEAMSHAYKVDEGTVRSIIIDWMRFERAWKDGTYA